MSLMTEQMYGLEKSDNKSNHVFWSIYEDKLSLLTNLLREDKYWGGHAP